jgi:cytochrome c biogenesis protein CcmG/thiol:disulfide interchange protein DsbE
MFIVFVLLLYLGLSNNSRLVHSPLIDKAVPDFNLRVLQSESYANSSNFPDDVFLLNIWASWCVACIKEHQVLNLINSEKKVRLIGINYKDNEDDAIGWLKIYGNPYEYNIIDKGWSAWN